MWGGSQNTAAQAEYSCTSEYSCPGRIQLPRQNTAAHATTQNTAAPQNTGHPRIQLHLRIQLAAYTSSGLTSMQYKRGKGPPRKWSSKVFSISIERLGMSHLLIYTKTRMPFEGVGVKCVLRFKAPRTFFCCIHGFC